MVGHIAGKEEFLAQIEGEWQRFLDVVREIPESDRVLPNAVGYWSVRDALVHVAAWDNELVSLVERYRAAGEETHYGDDEAVDRLNQVQVEEKQGLSLGQVWDGLLGSHQRVLQLLQGLPEEAFARGSYTGDWIAGVTPGHYREHREDLERWKAGRP